MTQDLNDQASALRQEMDRQGDRGRSKSQTPILAIASGKGGVGKSNIAVNLAWEMGRMGKRVLIFDADFGLGNTDILLGITTEKSLADAFLQGKSLEEIAVTLENGVTLIPAGSGDFHVANMNPLALEGVFFELENLISKFDVVVVDSGAGIGERVRNTLLFASHVAVVTTPDPTSLTDSYATIKVVSQRDHDKPFSVIVNMVDGISQGEVVFNHLAHVARKYLDVTLDFWGAIPRDGLLQAAVRRQQIVTEAYPGAMASRAIQKMAARFVDRPLPKENTMVGDFLRYFFGGGRKTGREESRLAL